MKSVYGSRISQKILHCVMSCFPFCKPSPILARDGCNAPVCVEITTKLCVKILLSLLCGV